MLSTAGDDFRVVPPSSRRELAASIDTITDVAVNEAAIVLHCRPRLEDAQDHACPICLSGDRIDQPGARGSVTSQKRSLTHLSVHEGHHGN